MELVFGKMEQTSKEANVAFPKRLVRSWSKEDSKLSYGLKYESFLGNFHFCFGTAVFRVLISDFSDNYINYSVYIYIAWFNQRNLK